MSDYVDQREAGQVLGLRPSEVLTLLVSDSVDVIQVSARRWRVERSAWDEWRTITAPQRSKQALADRQRRQQIARQVATARVGLGMPDFLRG